MSQWVAKLDNYGQPAWLLLVAVALLVAWPLGIAAFVYLVASGRMTLGWSGDRGSTGFGSFNRAWRGGGCGRRGWSGGSFSGNAAFDDYRRETLKKLEDEEREFRAYLERLRKARDQSEFEQFMADRRAGKQSN